MLDSIKFHLSHLADFGGREGRRTFWLWFLAIAIVNILVSIGLSASMTAGAMGAAMEGVRAGQDSAAMEAAVLKAMLPNMPTMVWVGVAMSAFNAVMLSAAFVRRLHDGGFPGWIVIVPLAAMAFSAWLSIAQLGYIEELLNAAMNAGSAEGMADLQRETSLQGLVGWIPLLVVIGFGIVKSKPANRWGEAPVT